ncbi:unnamed protein product [Cuscuta europaea]|uniref:DUF4283 domain-containing protein n=1 Tax=Cuscuta europaea TaxID=41803 RepID=A0A9P0Z191_CUSEU|nr:unnamed protein product [Cuscuta europaea]
MPKSTAKKKEVQPPTKYSSRLKAKAKDKELEDALSAMEQMSDSDFEGSLHASDSEGSSKQPQPQIAVQPPEPEVNSLPPLKQDIGLKEPNKEMVEKDQNVGNLDETLNGDASVAVLDVVLVNREPTIVPQTQVDGDINDLYVAALGKTVPLNKTETTMPKPFASLFKDNREPSKGMKLRFIEPVGDFVDLHQRIMPSIEEIWGHCLVGYFAGRYPGFKPIQELVAKWGVPCKVRTHDRGWVIFKFQGEEDRSKVLMEGPYTLFGKSLYLKSLSEDFSFESEEFLKVPIWVKFPNLPMQIWNEDVISEIASRVGVPLTTDRVTQERAISRYARVVIEVDASKPPPPPLTLKVRLPNGRFHFQKLIYETFPNYCFHCKGYGHHAFTCKVIAENEKREREEKEAQEMNKRGLTKEDKGKGKVVAPTNAAAQGRNKGETSNAAAKEGDKGDNTNVATLDKPYVPKEEHPFIKAARLKKKKRKPKKKQNTKEDGEVSSGYETLKEQEDEEVEPRKINSFKDFFDDEVIIEMEVDEFGEPTIKVAHLDEVTEPITRLNHLLQVVEATEPGVYFTKKCLEQLPGVKKRKKDYVYTSMFMRCVYRHYLYRYFEDGHIMGNGSKVKDLRNFKRKSIRVVRDIKEAYLDDVITKIEFQEGAKPKIHLMHCDDVEVMMTRLDNYLDEEESLARKGITFTVDCLKSLPGVTQTDQGYEFSSTFITNVYDLFLARYRGCEEYREWKRRQWEVARPNKRKGRKN